MSRSANPPAASRDFAPAISRRSTRSGSPSWPAAAKAASPATATSLRALATANIDQARAFVARELGALAAADDTTRRLAATVRTYLDENGSRARTAKRLNIHENTVSYRLRQAEEILGRSVDKRTLELRVALTLADLVDETLET